MENMIPMVLVNINIQFSGNRINKEKKIVKIRNNYLIVIFDFIAYLFVFFSKKFRLYLNVFNIDKLNLCGMNFSGEFT